MKNVQWSVCARNADGELVVSLWQHRFLPLKGEGIARYVDSLGRWRGPGNAEARENITEAFKSGRVLRAVIAHAERPDLVDSGADASQIRKTFSVREDWIGRVTRLEGDEFEMEFRRFTPG